MLKNSEIEKHLNGLAVAMVQQKGLHFATFDEAQHHIKETASNLRDLLQQSSVMFLEGLKHLSETNHQPAASIAKRLLDHHHDPKEMANIIESKIVNSNQSLEFFSEAVNSFYDCGDYKLEECVISVLLTLFPLEPQPFACYGTLIWRRDGITEAASYYENIVDLFESPILDYFAADCFYQSGNKANAKRLLHRGLENAKKSPEIYEDIAQFIRIALKEFNLA